MTDQPPTGDRPDPEAQPPAPEAPAPEPMAPEAVVAAPEAEPVATAAAAPMPVAPPPPSEATYIAPAATVPPPAQPAWQAPPAAPPKTPEVPGAPGRYFAATVTRVAALLVDTLLLGIVAVIMVAILSALLPGQFDLDGEPTMQSFGPGFVIAGLGGLVVSYLYFFLSWRSAGRATPGQRVFKMQVGNAFDGAALTPRQITIRWLTLFGLGILSALPVLAGLGGLATVIWDIVLLVTTATSATKQGIHDRWAGSAVVATGPQNTTLAWGCLMAYVVGIFVIIILALAIIAAIFAAIYSIQ